MRPRGKRVTVVAVAGPILLVAGATAGVVLAGRDDPEPTGPTIKDDFDDGKGHGHSTPGARRPAWRRLLRYVKP